MSLKLAVCPPGLKTAPVIGQTGHSRAQTGNHIFMMSAPLGTLSTTHHHMERWAYELIITHHHRHCTQNRIANEVGISARQMVWTRQFFAIIDAFVNF